MEIVPGTEKFSPLEIHSGILLLVSSRPHWRNRPNGVFMFDIDFGSTGSRDPYKTWFLLNPVGFWRHVNKQIILLLYHKCKKNTYLSLSPSIYLSSICRFELKPLLAIVTRIQILNLGAGSVGLHGAVMKWYL